MSKILVVRNLAQRILFDFELKGQISDGQWENSKPYDHYKPWCEAEVVIGQDVGRNFYARRDTYNFTNKDLLEVVGARMMRDVRRGIIYGYDKAEDLNRLADLEGKCEMPGANLTGDYWDENRSKLSLYNLEEIATVSENEKLYNMKSLLNDLRDLKKIVKMRSTSEKAA